MTATAEYLREYRRQIKAGERVPGKRVHPSPWCREGHEECNRLRAEIRATGVWEKVKKHPSWRCSEHQECLDYRRERQRMANDRKRTPKYRRPRRSPVPVEGAPHGTRQGYADWLCGCEECKGWSAADYQKRKYAAQAADDRMVLVSNPSKCQVCGVPVLSHDLLRRCG